MVDKPIKNWKITNGRAERELKEKNKGTHPQTRLPDTEKNKNPENH